jgi:hypothetical protein
MAGNVVNDDGILSLPLFHGTSTYFWPSIKQHGLGGVNIVEEWRLLPLLRESLAILREVQDPEIISEMRLRLPMLNHISEQRVSGGVYLTLCSWKAVSYGCRGFGSELVGQVAETLDLLAKARPEAEAELLSKYPEAAHARSAKHQPILIRVDDVHIECLLSEKGDHPQNAIALAQTLIDCGDSEPQVSFELIGAAQSRQLSAAEGEVTDERYGLPRAWTSTPLA